MRFRVAMRESRDLSLTPRGYAKKASAQQYIADDLAGDVVALLSSGARIDDEVVCPGHLAVLVRTNRQAAMVRQALDDAGVPAVINGAGSVFGTETAREWLRLIEALERPASITRAHSAALTCFIGWSAERLATATDDEDGWAWEDVHRRLHDWARVLRTRGVAALLETITVAQDLSARMLADADGERRLTDLRHVGQLLHTAASAEQLGPTALAAWLRTRIAEALSGLGDEERSRRLESDAEAVQVLTIHRSKGLEFPIVYAPFLWEGWEPRGTPPVFFHDPGRARPLVARRLARGPRLRPPPRAVRPRAARRGAAARLRRAHPRAPPGRSCGGPGPTTAATPRSAGCCSPATTPATSPPRAPRRPTTSRCSPGWASSPSGRRGRSASNGRRRTAPPAGARRRPPIRSWPPRRSTAGWTCAGGGPPTPTSPRPATRRGSAPSPSSR